MQLAFLNIVGDGVVYPKDTNVFQLFARIFKAFYIDNHPFSDFSQIKKKRKKMQRCYSHFVKFMHCCRIKLVATGGILLFITVILQYGFFLSTI